MRRKRIDWAQFLSLPALILFSIFFVYPLLKGIGMSLTDWDGMGQAEFVGLKNFANFFSDDRAMQDIKTTLIFAIGSAALLNLVGLCYALLMNSDFRGKSIARVIIYLPCYHQPFDYGIHLVFPAAAGAGLPRLCICSAGTLGLDRELDGQILGDTASAGPCKCLAIFRYDNDYLFGGAPVNSFRIC